MRRNGLGMIVDVGNIAEVRMDGCPGLSPLNLIINHQLIIQKAHRRKIVIIRL